MKICPGGFFHLSDYDTSLGLLTLFENTFFLNNSAAF